MLQGRTFFWMMPMNEPFQCSLSCFVNVHLLWFNQTTIWYMSFLKIMCGKSDLNVSKPFQKDKYKTTEQWLWNMTNIQTQVSCRPASLYSLYWELWIKSHPPVLYVSRVCWLADIKHLLLLYISPPKTAAWHRQNNAFVSLLFSLV